MSRIFVIRNPGSSGGNAVSAGSAGSGKTPNAKRIPVPSNLRPLFGLLLTSHGVSWVLKGYRLLAIGYFTV
jgi:hypothetical protein